MGEYLHKVYNYFEAEQNVVIHSKVGIEQSAFSVFLLVSDECVLVEIDEHHHTCQGQVVYLFAAQLIQKQQLFSIVYS